MIIGRPEGTTRVCGKAQGFLGLPIRDDVVEMPGQPGQYNQMTTAWFPTDKELDALNAGAAVYVQLIGATPMPMMVTVGEAADAV